MGIPDASPRVYHFGGFTLDAHTGELYSGGNKRRLREQPRQLLLILLEVPGELVTREEIVGRLWPAGTFVDVDRGLNKVVNHLREALGDSADQPHFVETLPRKGYRFIASVRHGQHSEEDAPMQMPPRRRRITPTPTALVAGLACVTIVIAANVGNARSWIASRWQTTPQISALAVIPPENLSRDPEQVYFADGMTDALITDLAEISGVRVTSRTSVMRYQGTRLKHPINRPRAECGRIGGRYGISFG